MNWHSIEVSGNSQSTTEASESNTSRIFDDFISSNSLGDDNPDNQEQNQDSLVNGASDSLNQQNQQTDEQENLQNLLSDDLISQSLAGELVEEDLLVMPIY